MVKGSKLHRDYLEVRKFLELIFYRENHSIGTYVPEFKG